MGYSTSFTLQVQTRKGSPLVSGEITEDLISQLRKSYEEAEWSLDYVGQDSGDDSRWYDHEKDMREFSAAHPDFLFVLSGEGEDNGDIWTEYHLAGKCQVAKARVQVAPFNPEALK